MDGFLTSTEIIQTIINKAIGKVSSNVLKQLLLGILGGLFIAFGANASIVVMQNLMGINLGIAKLLGACVFPVGLILITLTESELFTGNNLLILAVYDKKINFCSLLKSWIAVYFGNFIGSFLLGFMVVKSGILTANTFALVHSTAQAKIDLTFTEAFIRGICCNILVVLAVWLATGAKDVTSKMLSCFFPVMIFVLSGFEHSIANMYYFSAAHISGFPFSWQQIILTNLLPVTLGNMLGGIIIPLTYYLAFVEFEKQEKIFKLKVLQPLNKINSRYQIQK